MDVLLVFPLSTKFPWKFPLFPPGAAVVPTGNLGHSEQPGPKRPNRPGNCQHHQELLLNLKDHCNLRTISL